MSRTETERIINFQNIMSPCLGTRFENNITELLRQMNFFKAPASINHHGAYEGALFDHSLIVTKQLLYLTDRLDLEWNNRTSPLIVGMFHDLCKVDNYVKNDNGEWEHNKNVTLSGHGDKSIMILSQIMALTDEEIHCICWHMGAFDDKENWNMYGRSVTLYPNVLWTHTADMIAARICNI